MMDIDLERRIAHMGALIRESIQAKDWEMLEVRAIQLQAMAGDLMAQKAWGNRDPAKDRR